MIILGLVGSIAAGKSTVARYLAEKGAWWIDADKIAKQTLFDREVIDALSERFGDKILEDGQVSRSALAGLVFGTDSKSKSNLQFLESIVHPLTRTRIRQELKNGAQHNAHVGLLDVPLLFEAKWDLVCDQIWCVDASFEIRQSRCAARGWDSDELLSLIHI